MSSQTIGADDFLASAWPDGELLIDEEETLKKALGGQQYKNSWLLKPSVILRIAGVRKFGSAMDDLNDKSNMLGGVIVVGKEGVLYAEAESSSFSYPAADDVLAALRASPSRAPTSCEATPAQAEVA